MSYRYPGDRIPLKPRIHTVNGKWRVSFPGVSNSISAYSWDDACGIVTRYYLWSWRPCKGARLPRQLPAWFLAGKWGNKQ